MSSPASESLRAKGKQRATDDDFLTFGDSDDAFDSKSSSGSSSNGDSSSESDSVPDPGSSSGPKSESDTKAEAGEPPLSRDDLLAYLENMRRQFSKKPTTESFASEEEFLAMTPKKKDLPVLNPGQLPESYFTFETAKNGKITLARDVEVDKVENLASTSTQTGSQKYTPAPPPPPPEVGKSGKSLTKREKKALKTKTAGKDWFDLPAPAEADLPRLYREYEALRLRNHLDPKRFYRKDEGEGKGIKGLPKYFAIGTVLPTKTPFGEPSSANLTRAGRKRTLVEELLHDSEAKGYAKKKFKQMQEVRGANGRGQHTKKKAGMRPKW